MQAVGSSPSRICSTRKRATIRTSGTTPAGSTRSPTFSGVPVGATENIFVYLASAVGLHLISPPEFMQAVAEGNDPPAQTVAQFHDLVAGKKIKVLVYNVQTSTNITEDLKRQATQNGIPVVGVSETLQPIDATFQEWQDAQLLTLQNALNANALTH
ncbi:MAG: hypothetical protein E6J32_08600 [Chloroflexi bacterium]|nr:MAG: hypothetical protein E6J32_08600 [Chloroflexota bacterium]